MGKFKVALDAGHAGFNKTPGKRTPDGEYEWNFNDENVDAFIKEISNYENVEVKIVSDPTGKRDVPLRERTDLANDWKANIYLSFHHNANTGKWGTWTGTETYRFNKDTANAPKSKKLTELAHKASLDAYGLRDRGVKRANFHVLRETNMPATLLEGGYMDSTIDIKVMRDKKKTALLGTKVAQAVAKEYGLKRKNGTVAPIVPISKDEATIKTLYRVQAGAFKDQGNAVDFADKIRDKGFATYVVKVDGLFKVQIGAFANKENAEAQLKKVKAAKFDAFITVNGNTVAVPETEPINEAKQQIIAVDGYFGRDTVKMLQNRFDTPEDGIISGQYVTATTKKLVQSAVTYGKYGSLVIKQLQKYLKVTADGFFGPSTVKAMQRKLKVTADGLLGPKTIKALQNALNKGTF